MTILFKACLFNLTFYKGSHSKGLKQKSTACASKKNKTFHRKAFSATFHGSTDHFEKYGNFVGEKKIAKGALVVVFKLFTCFQVATVV